MYLLCCGPRAPRLTRLLFRLVSFNRHHRRFPCDQEDYRRGSHSRFGAGKFPLLISSSAQAKLTSVSSSSQRLLDEIEVAEDTSKPVEHKPSSTTRVLADGTYATETVYSSTVHEKEKIAKIRAAAKAPLRGESRLDPLSLPSIADFRPSLL